MCAWINGNELPCRWKSPRTEIEDVKGGICISIHLPCLANLSVKLQSDRKTIAVRAKRTSFHEADLAAVGLSKGPQCAFSQNLKMDAFRLKLEQGDVSHDYSSENGVLHVYVENVQLQKMSGEQRHSAMTSVFRSITRKIF